MATAVFLYKIVRASKKDITTQSVTLSDAFHDALNTYVLSFVPSLSIIRTVVSLILPILVNELAVDKLAVNRSVPSIKLSSVISTVTCCSVTPPGVNVRGEFVRVT